METAVKLRLTLLTFVESGHEKAVGIYSKNVQSMLKCCAHDDDIASLDNKVPALEHQETVLNKSELQPWWRI